MWDQRGAFRLHAWIARGTIACWLASSAHAAVVYVDDSAVNGGNDGTSWESAFLSLHDGLNAAQVGDEIRVGQGIYKPTIPDGHRDATFSLKHGVTIQGGYAGLDAADPNELDPTRFLTILSGDLNGNDVGLENYDENSYHVVTADGVDSSAVLRGVRIASGNANGDPYESPHDVGAGLWCINGAAPTLSDCVIELNQAWNYGGAYVEGSAASFTRCTFRSNHLFTSSTGYGAGLGAMGPVVVVDCLFENNSAMHGGGAAYGGGPFIDCTFANNFGEDGGALFAVALALNCTFIDNAACEGGGMAYGTPVNCRFFGNSALFGGGVAKSQLAVNCLFSGNTAWVVGGAVSNDGGPLHLLNCSIVGNFSDGHGNGYGGDGIFNESAHSYPPITWIRNCIVWDNGGQDEADQILVEGGSVVIDNSCVQGWTGALGGYGNFGDDPLLLDADGPDDLYGTEDDDARLSPDSPGRDAGNTDFVLDDKYDLDGDGNLTELTALDLGLLPRIVSGVVDLGAFEVQEPGCLADIAPPAVVPKIGDGQVNVDDLLAAFSAWGECSSSDCAADVTNDGQTDVDDVLLLIMQWGACP